jgi:F-type H+-transporting ATPase subunit a
MLGYLPLPTNTQEKVDIFGAEIPSFALYAATANLSIPLVLTLVVWFAYNVEGVRAKGFIGYLKSSSRPA